ncbi:NAD(P)H-hydrate dehydratase [Glaciimonas sp. PCH181]|uniref:NAD(P)H-hydrate dehydratase n=1 Tax=Glaciimonas sp. PCH181 TaxID=2133943 RepID=UPI000D3D0BC9|nr:NAD(P)H-hydrate dehydratase [Glaciimonas sp. PCH181]PUA16489.1 bifunctional ADP-dependent NAD(P)H-hydrate dehydratase/NAD(P)H-hydrate epimerase [Glaciimonas sp. PCH181]
MTALYSSAEIRRMEQAALSQLPPYTLMQRAGKAAAEAAISLLPGSAHKARILVLVGPGNNGGDALEAAAILTESGAEVVALLPVDMTSQPPDAANALSRAARAGVHFMPPEQFTTIDGIKWSLVIDGLLGIGLKRPLDGALRSLVATVNTFTSPLLALDIPTGLDAETGMVVGPDGISIIADATVTFIGDKIGLHSGDGPEYAGKVTVAGLDIASRQLLPSQSALNAPELFSSNLQPRARNSHKGSFGSVAVIGGAGGMAGAAILAGRAAAKSGAGKVFIGFLDAAPSYDSAQPELMCRHADDIDLATATLVVGTGLGTSPPAHAILVKALQAQSHLLLDADALNLIAVEPGLQQLVAQRSLSVYPKRLTVMTPHPLEAARLLGISTTEIQSDRLAAARSLAQRFNAVIVLKGAGSIIARPDGYAVVNPTGNPALATGGSGDVLSGICGALLAQGWSDWHAALGAVWLHGCAADMLVSQGFGPIGMTAGELIPAVRSLLNELTKK